MQKAPIPELRSGNSPHPIHANIVAKFWYCQHDLSRSKITNLCGNLLRPAALWTAEISKKWRSTIAPHGWLWRVSVWEARNIERGEAQPFKREGMRPRATCLGRKWWGKGTAALVRPGNLQEISPAVAARETGTCYPSRTAIMTAPSVFKTV